LPDPRCYRQPERCRSTVSVGVTRPSSLLPAHAPDHNPLADFGCPYFDKSLQVATSPCWEMALPDVISAIFVWVLGSVPRHDRTVHFDRFFLLGIGLSLGSRRSTRERFPRTASRGGIFRGCNHSLMFRLPYLLGPLAVLTRSRNLQPPSRIHRAEPVPLPDTGTGIATCPNPDN